MHNIIFLSLEEIVGMHEIQVEKFGGSHGIRDVGLLESAVMMPRASFGECYLHKDIFEMAAAYMYHIIKNHAFVDGNKRTGTVAALTFLTSNKMPIKFSQEYLFTLAIEVATSSITKEDLADKLRAGLITQ